MNIMDHKNSIPKLNFGQLCNKATVVIDVQGEASLLITHEINN